MKHLIFVGACYLDTILSVPHYPEEDSKLRANSLSLRRGGNCPNSLEVLQQLIRDDDSVAIYLVSSLPNAKSAAVRQIKESFGDDSKVNLHHCLYREDHTEAASSYIMRSEQSGSRTLVNYNNLPEMTTHEFERVVQSFTPFDDTWWHFEGRIPETTLQCFRTIRQVLPAAKVSVEVEKPAREGLLGLAAEADVVFFSKTWAEHKGHRSASSCLRTEVSPQTSIALCTWGAQGASALFKHGGAGQGILDCPVSPRVHEEAVKDTVGAGDTFIAGMLYCLTCHTTGWSDIQKLRFAVGLAAAKVQHEGFHGLTVKYPPSSGSK